MRKYYLAATKKIQLAIGHGPSVKHYLSLKSKDRSVLNWQTNFDATCIADNHEKKQYLAKLASLDNKIDIVSIHVDIGE